MKILLEYSGKKISLTPYNTEIEKDILLYLSISDDFNIDGCLDILKDYIDYDISTLTISEKKVLLYKLRSISIGEEINIKFKCKCGRVNEQSTNISELVSSNNLSNKLIKDRFKILTDDNFQDFINIDINELDLNEYDKLYNETKNSITKFNFNKSNKCFSCKEPYNYKIDNIPFILDNMSEDSLMSIYQTISNLVFFSHYTKADVDNMIPFERSILISILNKTKEELDK